MKNETFYVCYENFLVFIHKAFSNFNFKNTEYIENLKHDYFLNSDNVLPYYKALPKLRKILIENGYDKANSQKISHWRSLGYTDRNEMRAEIIREYKNTKSFSFFIFDNDDKKIKEFFKEVLINFNYTNVDYFNYIKSELFKEYLYINPVPGKTQLLNIIYKDQKCPSTAVNILYWTARGYTEEDAKIKISNIQKTNSKRCKEYYLSRGYSEHEAETLVSGEQRKFSYCSKNTKEYWINHGFDEVSAQSLASEYTSKSSVWSESYWIQQGYTLDEAKEKVLEYNPSSPKFIKYHNDYELYIKKLKRSSENALTRWKQKEYQNKIIYLAKEGKFSGKSVSKEEIKTFNFLKENVDENIKHEPYVVSIPDDSNTSVNSYFYSCDGYLKDNNNIIIFEYDGAVFHNDKKDEMRDYDILSIDNRIIGIIRISSTFYLNKNYTKDFKIKTIKDAIHTIKNSTEVRIKLR